MSFPRSDITLDELKDIMLDHLEIMNEPHHPLDNFAVDTDTGKQYKEGDRNYRTGSASRRRPPPPLIIDVRTYHEVAATGLIPTAINIPLNELANQLAPYTSAHPVPRPAFRTNDDDGTLDSLLGIGLWMPPSEEMPDHNNRNLFYHNNNSLPFSPQWHAEGVCGHPFGGIVFSCMAGVRSRSAASIARSLGYPAHMIQNYMGGWAEYSKHPLTFAEVEFLTGDGELNRSLHGYRTPEQRRVRGNLIDYYNITKDGDSLLGWDDKTNDFYNAENVARQRHRLRMYPLRQMQRLVKEFKVKVQHESFWRLQYGVRETDALIKELEQFTEPRETDAPVPTIWLDRPVKPASAAVAEFQRDLLKKIEIERKKQELAMEAARKEAGFEELSDEEKAEIQRLADLADGIAPPAIVGSTREERFARANELPPSLQKHFDEDDDVHEDSEGSPENERGTPAPTSWMDKKVGLRHNPTFKNNHDWDLSHIVDNKQHDPNVDGKGWNKDEVNTNCIHCIIEADDALARKEMAEFERQEANEEDTEGADEFIEELLKGLEERTEALQREVNFSTEPPTDYYRQQLKEVEARERRAGADINQWIPWTDGKTRPPPPSMSPAAIKRYEEETEAFVDDFLQKEDSFFATGPDLLKVGNGSSYATDNWDATDANDDYPEMTPPVSDTIKLSDKWKPRKPSNSNNVRFAAATQDISASRSYLFSHTCGDQMACDRGSSMPTAASEVSQHQQINLLAAATAAIIFPFVIMEIVVIASTRRRRRQGKNI